MNIHRLVPRDRQIQTAPTPEEIGRWKRQSLWRSLTLWRCATALALILAAACGGALIARPAAGPPASTILVASLGPPDLMEPYIVTFDIGTGRLTAPGQPAPDPTKSAQLWITPEGGPAQSIALLDPSRPLRMEVPRALARKLAEGVDVTVTLEPLGGSTTGAPSGPVVATGTLALIS